MMSLYSNAPSTSKEHILGKILSLNPDNLRDQDGQRVEGEREGGGPRRRPALFPRSRSPIRTFVVRSPRPTLLPRTYSLPPSLSLSPSHSLSQSIFRPGGNSAAAKRRRPTRQSRLLQHRDKTLDKKKLVSSRRNHPRSDATLTLTCVTKLSQLCKRLEQSMRHLI